MRVVLARYMQILPPAIVARYPGQIITVHHSFLPAFTGARPYHAAFARGVKLIGATSHYVTEEPNAGPIIEQDVARISHREQVEDLVKKGRDLERTVLGRAALPGSCGELSYNTGVWLAVAGPKQMLAGKQPVAQIAKTENTCNFAAPPGESGSFLQGSYCNDTNVYAESDVDVVTCLKTVFHHDVTGMTPPEQTAFAQALPNGTDTFAGFKAEVLLVLRNRFGASVTPGPKAIKIPTDGARRNADVKDYLRYMQLTRGEADALFRELLIGVTNFFRDAEIFDEVQKQVIPQLFAGKTVGSVIRVWVPGCSTGEEAYSIAMLLRERMEERRETFKVQIFATDIDRDAKAFSAHSVLK